MMGRDGMGAIVNETENPLAQFLAAAPPGIAARTPVAEIVRGIADVAARVRSAWPRLELDEARLAALLGARVDLGEDPVAALAGLYAEDLWLAEACACGEPLACAAFDREFGRDIARSAAAAAPDAPTADDFGQALLHKLLIGGKRGPKLREYAGRGPLRGWLLVVARRTWIDLRRAEARAQRPVDPALTLGRALDDDPELAYLAASSRAVVRAAFEDALRGLDPRTRNVLRLHMVHRLGIDRIARVYDVHRTTIWRWLDAARSDLVAATLASLARRVPADELDGMVRLLGSRLDLTLSRVLAGDGADTFP